jgi:hypothetical protein
LGGSSAGKRGRGGGEKGERAGQMPELVLVYCTAVYVDTVCIGVGGLGRSWVRSEEGRELGAK